MRPIVLCLMLAAAAAAEPDALITYRKALRRLDRQETKYWGDYESAFRTALRLYPSNVKLHYAIGRHYLLNWNSLSQQERDFGWATYKKAASLTVLQR